ncbi:NUDIX hydrolase [Leptolyngbya sp. FACHB-261]|uniref:NUDIX domain-containing protein n=1 Tax=Leptolyngbya sp. FACHB-261 TaxID=2692806 RepID=UPI0016852B6E|nr:NUDIX hydrolase [Leptolyngbya sp. FACHB-261]MBD2102300.1 NUDIX hydrolase [Leptolyngbya sp. FACHB-261]
MTDKPLGKQLGWHLLGSTCLLATPWLRLRQDQLLLGQESTTYEYLQQPAAVFIVPVMADGTVVLIRQYRYPVDQWCLEVPAGGLHDHPDAYNPNVSQTVLAAVARKELAEEIGGTCRELLYQGCFYPTTSRSDERSHVFLALGVTLEQPQALENGELIERVLLNAAEAMHLASSAQMPDAKSALALLWCAAELKARGLL